MGGIHFLKLSNASLEIKKKPESETKCGIQISEKMKC
jgi:hypothetical protein